MFDLLGVVSSSVRQYVREWGSEVCMSALHSSSHVRPKWEWRYRGGLTDATETSKYSVCKTEAGSPHWHELRSVDFFPAPHEGGGRAFERWSPSQWSGRLQFWSPSCSAPSETFGFQDEDITTLTDEVEAGASEAPTRDNIVSFLMWSYIVILVFELWVDPKYWRIHHSRTGKYGLCTLLWAGYYVYM